MRHTFAGFVPSLACLLVAASAVAQTGRTMLLSSVPVPGGNGVFLMQHPPLAAGRFNFFVATLPFPGAIALPLPGFLSNGLVRIDLGTQLTNHVTILDGTGVTSWALPIPNVPNAVGFAFDVQTVDIDFAVNDLAWADNDIAAVVQSPPRLVINEVDYDQGNTDTASFVEIMNVGGSAMPLAGIELRLVNGANNQQYGSIALSLAGASLPPGG